MAVRTASIYSGSQGTSCPCALHHSHFTVRPALSPCLDSRLVEKRRNPTLIKGICCSIFIQLIISAINAVNLFINNKSAKPVPQQPSNRIVSENLFVLAAWGQQLPLSSGQHQLDRPLNGWLTMPYKRFVFASLFSLSLSFSRSRSISISPPPCFRLLLFLPNVVAFALCSTVRSLIFVESSLSFC